MGGFGGGLDGGIGGSIGGGLGSPTFTRSTLGGPTAAADTLFQEDFTAPTSGLGTTYMPPPDPAQDTFFTRFERTYCNIPIREGLRMTLSVNVTNLVFLIIFIVLYTFLILPVDEDNEHHYVWGMVLGTLTYILLSTVFRCYLGY